MDTDGGHPLCEPGCQVWPSVEQGASQRATAAFIVPHPAGRRSQTGPSAHSLARPHLRAVVSPWGRVSRTSHSLTRRPQSPGWGRQGPSGLHLASWVVLSRWKAKAASGRLGSPRTSSQASCRIGGVPALGVGPPSPSFPQGGWKHHLPNLSIISGSSSQRRSLRHCSERPSRWSRRCWPGGRTFSAGASST